MLLTTQMVNNCWRKNRIVMKISQYNFIYTQNEEISRCQPEEPVYYQVDKLKGACTTRRLLVRGGVFALLCCRTEESYRHEKTTATNDFVC